MFAQTLPLKTTPGTKALSRLMVEAPNDDRVLLRQLARGDEQAFSILYERYQGPLYRFAWNMSGDSATAEEITQEVFMLLIRGTIKYDPAKGSVASYLFGIARNLTRRSLNRNRLSMPLREESGEEEGGVADSTADNLDILDELSHRQLIECLQKAVLSLPDLYREVVSLCDLEQMSYTDAAELLQCSPGTIASRLHRARAMLKTKLRSQGHGDKR